MGDNSKIQWTEATWNPVVGCTKVSRGCRHCYAEQVARRFQGIKNFSAGDKSIQHVFLKPERLDQPLRWKRPRRIFVNSMSDLFHEDVPFEFIARVWDTMFDSGQHTYQILTKRPKRLLEFERWMNDVQNRRIDYRNVWLGVSVEDQRTADERITFLLQTPAAVRWVSYEPALGPVNFRYWFPHVIDIDDGGNDIWWPDQDNAVDWIVVGGESGPRARPFDLAWARSTIEQCKVTGVPCFYKQGGASNACPHDRKGGHFDCFPEDLRVREYPA